MRAPRCRSTSSLELLLRAALGDADDLPACRDACRGSFTAWGRDVSCNARYQLPLGAPRVPQMALLDVAHKVKVSRSSLRTRLLPLSSSSLRCVLRFKILRRRFTASLQTAHR